MFIQHKKIGSPRISLNIMDNVDGVCSMGAPLIISLHNKWCVSHCGLAIYIQKYLEGKRRIVKTQILKH
jgi:hypothetical protein